MESASWFSVSSFVFLLVGAGAGVAAGHFFSPAIGEAKRLREDLERVQREHDGYRASVNSHFRKTADLVGQMTKSYAAVYDHLAGGARTFCDDAGADTAIPFEPLPGVLASPVIETAAEEALEDALDESPEELVEEGLEEYAAMDGADAESIADEAGIGMAADAEARDDGEPRDSRYPA